MSTPNWPIRVGGEYETSDVTGLLRRVTVIDGDHIYFVRVWAKTGELCSTGDVSEKSFRRMSRPEDQSPIPDLVAALKLIVEKFGWHGDGSNAREEFYCEVCGAHSLDCFEIPHGDDCPITVARAALAKAEGRAS